MSGQGRPKEYKHRISFNSSTEEELYEAFKKTAAREGKPLSDLFTEFMEDYNKKHGSNPQPDLNKFLENPAYVAVPSILETPDKWRKYLDNCSIEEIARIQAMARTIDQKSKELTLRKRFVRK